MWRERHIHTYTHTQTEGERERGKEREGGREREREGDSPLMSLLINALFLSDQGPTLTTKFNLTNLTLITALEVPAPNTVTLVVRASTYFNI